MKFRRFEEMPVWQDARKLTVLVYSLTQGTKFAKDYGLRDQIQRSAVSVMSNIAEGYERATRKELLLFISYAKGSVGEIVVNSMSLSTCNTSMRSNLRKDITSAFWFRDSLPDSPTTSEMI